MAPSPQSPELFDVMPAGQLQRALRQSLSEGTTLVWEHIGNLDVTQGKLGVLDAGGCDPRHPREAKTLDWPFPQVEVWLQFAKIPGGKEDRVFAALLSAPGKGLVQEQADWETKEGESMAIDSASAAVSDYGRLLTECRAGGPLSHSCLGKGSADLPDQMQARKQAAAYLGKHGFPTRIETWATGSISITFSPGLTDEQVTAANAMLAKAGFQDRAWIAGSHTSGLIEKGLTGAPFMHVDDGRSPYLFAFKTGFGDGIYYWDGLWRGGQLCGYLCNFVPAEDENEDEAETAEVIEIPEAELLDAELLEPELPAGRRNPLRAELAPPTAPGVLVAVRMRANFFWIARVGQQTPEGWAVQYPTGERANIKAENVIPIPNRPVFNVGDEVLALWYQPAMYPGKITAVSQQGYTVAWSDGDTPLVVALGTLTFLSWT